jgi:hypothetical protein
MEEIKKEKNEHMKQVIAERQTWHQRIKEYKTTDNACAIYLDGMDQEKTDIPNLPNIDVKSFGSNLKVR